MITVRSKTVITPHSVRMTRLLLTTSLANSGLDRINRSAGDFMCSRRSTLPLGSQTRTDCLVRNPLYFLEKRPLANGLGSSHLMPRNFVFLSRTADPGGRLGEGRVLCVFTRDSKSDNISVKLYIQGCGLALYSG